MFRRLIPRSKPPLSRDEILKALNMLHKSKADVSEIKDFEIAFAENLGVKYAFSVSKGRVALYTILKALGVGPNDEVILPPYTCLVVPRAITYSGATPVYADIDADTYNIEPEKIERAITKKTRAIVPHHLFGQPAEMDIIREIAEKYDLKVIEDAAQSLGARYKKRKVGTLGDAAFFSFDLSKNITTIDGGMIVTNSDELAEKICTVVSSYNEPSYQDTVYKIMKMLGNYILMKPYLYEAIGFPLKSVIGSLAPNFHPSINRAEMLSSEIPKGYLTKLSNFQARIGLLQLKKLDSFNAERTKRAKELTEFLENEIPQISPPKISKYSEHVFLRYAVRITKQKTGIPRGDFVRELKKRGVVAGDWFDYVVHPDFTERKKMNYSDGLCPNSEKAAEQVINLPMHHDLKDSDMEKIKSAIKNIIKKIM